MNSMDEVQRYENGVTGVFWDAEECRIPCGLNALSVSKKIRSALKNQNFRGVTSIFAYGSTKDIMTGFDSSAGRLVHRKPHALDYRGAGDIYENESSEIAIVMNPTKPGDKSERYGAFIRGVFSWAFDNHPPANMILILGDVAKHMWRLISAFYYLRDSGYNVAFVQPQTQASIQLIEIGLGNPHT